MNNKNILDKVFEISNDKKDEIESIVEDEVALETAINNKQVVALSDIGARYKYYTAIEESLVARYKPIMDEMNAEIKFVQDRKERLKKLATFILPPALESDYVDDAISFFYQSTTSVDIYDNNAIPLDFTRVITEADKKKIKESLLAGEDVPGAKLIQRYHLQIKPGGLIAKNNQKKRIKNRLDRIIESE